MTPYASTSEPLVVTIPRWAEARPGLGQGGFSAGRFQASLPVPVVVSFRSPIPLDTPLEVVSTPRGWTAIDTAGDEPVVVMEAEPRPDGPLEVAPTSPVTIEAARAGRNTFATTAADHEAVHCFSCGLQPDTMAVHPGRLPDSPDSPARTGTDWTPPPWTARRSVDGGPSGPGGPSNGSEGDPVDDTIVWTVLDCVQGFHAGHQPTRRQAVTGRYTVEVLAPVRVGDHYALVAYDGGGSGRWEGRKRWAAANLFDADGHLVARSSSLWIALDKG